MPQQLPDEILYDTRLIERHIAKGLITRESVEKRRLAAPDATEHGEVLDLDQFAAGARGSSPKRPG